MTTLSQKYANKDTRDGIAVNKSYLAPFHQFFLEPGYNIREADEQHVEYFAQCWAEGAPLPPLTVIVKDNGLLIVDGQHRYLGAQRAIERGHDIARIECKDFTGTEADRVAFMDVPQEIKERIKQGQMSYASGVAVTREHGEKAVEVVEEAHKEAKAAGKDKITAKQLNKKQKKETDVPRIMQLLQGATQAAFGKNDYLCLQPGVIDEMELINGR
ncbi:hypothetical protein GH714_044116 [Hevea brasiliensis]|uniref:ParB/Sulfiredoxin domain-containing protein n=1 Tax=Hevea brasiliensis TaxID=3981 RepID=A0A6A6K0T1_HEVBR|nr:hypothetical protein GH714_044116 [Hevea brasiliensis]